MSTRYFTGGANDGNFGTAGNWDTSTAPVNGDTVIIGATNQNITAGLATGLTSIVLKITAGYGGSIGDASNSLTFTGSLEYAGRGAFAKFGSGGTISAGVFNHTGGTAYVSSGTWTSLTNGKGNIDIAAAAVVTTAYNVGGVFTAGYNATAFTTFNNSGMATISRACTTLNCKGGSVVSLDNGTTTYISNATVNVNNGAIYNKRSGGTDTTVTVDPGGVLTIDGTSGGAAGTVTVTTLNEYGGSRIIDAVPGLVLTVGTRNRIGVIGTSYT